MCCIKLNIARVLVQEDKFLHEENLLLQNTLIGCLEISFFLKVILQSQCGGSALDKGDCSICTDVAISLDVEAFGLQDHLSNTFHQE